MDVSCIAASLAALGGLWARAIWLQPRLPALIPLHFDLGGRPDSWGPPTGGNWFLLPGIATGLSALLLGIGLGLEWMARTTPDLINLPQKRAFLALAPEARVRVVAPLRRLLFLMPSIFCGLFAVMMEATAHVSENPESTLHWALAVVPIVVLLAITAVSWIAARRAVFREVRT